MTDLEKNALILYDILKYRQHSVGAEIGVFEGDTSRKLLSMLKDLKTLFCVDIWEQNQDFLDASPNKSGKIATANWAAVQNVFKERVIKIYPFRVCAMKMTSEEASRLIANESLDWVFIDANHSFKYVKNDIDIWSQKVKRGGIISGDDFIDKPLYGVKKAVRISFTEYSIEGKIWYAERI